MRTLSPFWLALAAACAQPGLVPDEGPSVSPRGRARGRAVGSLDLSTATTLFHGGVLPPASFGAWNGALGPVQGGRPDALLTAADGRILWTGALVTLEAALGDLEGVQRIDLAGGFVLPGLQDAHGHVENYGRSLEEVELRGARSYEEVIARVLERAETLPAGSWITGRGWDQNLWPEKRFPHHAALSAAVPGHPVLMSRVDGHAALANRRALEIAALLGSDGGQEEMPIPRPEGGEVRVGEDGLPTGVLVDTAIGLVSAHVPAPTRADRVRRIRLAQEALLEVGLTCVHDMGVDRETIGLYQELLEAGELKLRIVAYLWGNGLTSAKQLTGLPLAPDAADLLSVPGAKLMADGALGSRGAALLEPYSDAPGEVGLLRFEDPARLAAIVQLLAAAGMQPATHAIGDRANRLVLDVYAETLQSFPDFASTRPRIEHAQILSLFDVPRFVELGVVPSMQPTHCTSDMPWVPTRVGDQRALGAYAWRRLGGSSAHLAFGSDFPVERPHPLEGLFAALTRTAPDGTPAGGHHPDQRLSVDEALAGFTIGAAWAAQQDQRRGQLASGYFCDMTVIDVDPWSLDPDNARALLEARILMTVINGEVQHRAVP